MLAKLILHFTEVDQISSILMFIHLQYPPSMFVLLESNFLQKYNTFSSTSDMVKSIGP